MADDIWSRSGLSLPAMAHPSDMVVGQTEWGAPVYQTMMGEQYYEPMQQEQPRGSIMGGLASAFSAPARAMRGEPVTMADALGVAGMSLPLGALARAVGR